MGKDWWFRIAVDGEMIGIGTTSGRFQAFIGGTLSLIFTVEPLLLHETLHLL